MSGSDQHRQRATSTVDELVDLRGQPAAGPPNSMINWLVGQILVIRQSPL